jgi:hypothetical protein
MATRAAILLSSAAVCLWACGASQLGATADAGPDGSGPDHYTAADGGYATGNDGDDSGGGLPVDAGDGGVGLPVDAGDGGRSPLNPCGVPDATTYSCPAPSTDAGGCIGTPQPVALPASFIDDASHPVGCTATLPVCDPVLDDSGPVTCWCAAPDGLYNPSDANAWVCPR